MKEIRLESDREVEVFVAALYNLPVRGSELVLFDRCLSAIERVASVRYDEDGRPVIYEDVGRRVRAIRLKQGVDPVMVLEDVCVSFLRERIERIEWGGQAARLVLRVLHKLGDEAKDEPEREKRA